MSEGKNLSSRYAPQEVEGKWYQYWLEGGYFRADPNPAKEPFTIVIPPPNVTGRLHMGHALDNTLQDILIRWHRMLGDETLWLPGTDHAGIATQAVVEKHLAEQGLSRHELGREKFLEKVWEWKEIYEKNIIDQLKSLGASLDWSRLRFTMDEGLSKAVEEVFISYYEKGLIYRGDYIINWCPRCSTAISDLEVNYEEKESHLWHLRYPLKDGGYIEVATTRPETMLGDTAVAVHPEDKRYRDMIGKVVILPLMNREIPIIADEYVDKEFGTGAVKVTPGHDPNDFEMGQRHDLPIIEVIDKEGNMTEEAGDFAGLSREEARKMVVEALDSAGVLIKVEAHHHSVGSCDRCDTIIEPLVSTQWFLKTKELVKPAVEAVDEDQTTFVPERFTKVYKHWMENIRDWCISRQLWWGHRIPAYYCQDCNEMIVSQEEPDTCSRCGGSSFKQDADVLDTWFSSALWPFSTLGWPEETEDLKYFYPTSVLVTGYDIIFFWVARMMFSGTEFTKQAPFKYVLLHGLVRDAEGRKMSKSLGNGIDPLEVIEKYGADSLRFTLVTGLTPGNDMRFSWEKVEASRNFANKVWNAARFVLMNLEDFSKEGKSLEDIRKHMSLADRYILSRLNRTTIEVNRHLERFDIGESARVLYDFIWSEYCDWYIELSKSRLYDGSKEEKETAQHVLSHVLEHTMRLLHPFMPFISEEIWQKLPHEGETIVTASWPVADMELDDKESRQKMQTIIDIIRAIRNIRSELKVDPKKKAPVILLSAKESQRILLEEQQDYLKQMAAVSSITISEERDFEEKVMTAVVHSVEIVMPLEGLIDLDKERNRIISQIEEVERELKASKSKLANEGFVKKAPAEVVERERAKEQDLTEKLELLKVRQQQLGD